MAQNPISASIVSACIHTLNTAILNSNINSSASVISVSSTAPFNPGDNIEIESEIMQILSIDSATQLTVTRGILGTTAVAHSAGATVFQCQ